MSSRLQSSAGATVSLSPVSSTSNSQVSTTRSQRTPLSQPAKAWVDPASLPDYGDITAIEGNAPDYVKQLNSNTYFSYGVGDEDCFGHKGSCFYNLC